MMKISSQHKITPMFRFFCFWYFIFTSMSQSCTTIHGLPISQWFLPSYRSQVTADVRVGFEPTMSNLTTPQNPQVSGTIGLGDSAPCLITLLTNTTLQHSTPSSEELYLTQPVTHRCTGTEVHRLFRIIKINKIKSTNNIGVIIFNFSCQDRIRTCDSLHQHIVKAETPCSSWDFYTMFRGVFLSPPD